VSRCPKCKKYLKNVTALITTRYMKHGPGHVDVDEEITKVTGKCKTHGIVETDDWEYSDFYPCEESPTVDL